MNRFRFSAIAFSILWAASFNARAEVIIQYFETRWDEMYQRLPEIAELGYESIWTPPPSKSPIGGPYPYAYGGNVGYNSFDRFDLGDQPQRGHWETRYGSRTSLRKLVDNAHQLDIKIYPDIVFNHTGNGPDFRTYPGMHPRDFHITLDGSQPGGYRRPPRMFEWEPNNGTGGTLHQELVSLMDIVLEFDNRFQIGGANSVGYAQDPAPFVRQPGDYEKYPYHLSGTLPNENSREFIVRWINWLGYAMDYDGVRLDAPKHVYKDFFGMPNQSEFDRNRSFTYNIQRNFKERRSTRPKNTTVQGMDFSDMYKNDIRRDSALIYSEFFISGIGEVDYWRSPGSPGWGIQTRYLDFPRKKGMMQDAFQNGNLSALAGFSGFSPEEGIMFAHSHDEGPPSKLELAYAYILTRVGVPVVYFSGNNLRQDQIGRAPGKNTWMEKGYDYALGDTVNGFQSNVVPNLIYIHNQFARGREYNRTPLGEGGDFFAYERYQDLDNDGNPDPGECLMLVALNDSGWDQTRSNVQTSFAPGTKLKDYTGRNGDTVTVNGNGQVTIRVPGSNGQGFVCYAPFNAEAPTGVDPLQFGGSGVSTIPWVIPAGRDGAPKPARNLVRLSGGIVQIDVRYSNAGPQQNGETVDNVLLKWGQGRDINDNGIIDLDGKDVVAGGFETMTKITDGHYRVTANIANVPEGLHTIKARVFNGRTGKSAIYQTFTETVYVDRRGPDLEFENLGDGETIHGARTVTINNPDRTLYNLTYSIDGGPAQQADQVIKGKWRISLDGLAAGGHTLTLNATEADYASTRNVINTSTASRSFTVDTAGSSIAINHDNNVTLTEPFFKTTVTVPGGTGAASVKLYWNGYEQILTETSLGSGVFESSFDGRHKMGGVDKLFTGAFVNGPHFFEAVVNPGTANENRVSRRVVYNLYGKNMHDSDGDGIPDEIELGGFLDGTNPGPDQAWPGDNSKDLIPNFGESWSRLNAMAADTDYAGSWDGDVDSDGDSVTNLQEVIRGYRLTGDPTRYKIYDRSSTPPASSASAASATLTSPGGVKTVTVTYNPNDGSLKGITPVRVRLQPTGGGSTQFFTMTQVNSNQFTYAYTVPGGVTSVAYSFSNADSSVNDATGGSAWSIATPPVPSSATSTLGVNGSVRTLTIVYGANEGPLNGLNQVTINLTPTGGGTAASFAMAPAGDGSFTYTYTVPEGTSSVAYSFSSGATTDNTGASGWSASTLPGFRMDGEFDSQNFLVADSGMRIYAAIRGTKLYTATWSPKGGGNEHYLFITDTFGDPLPTSAAEASDSASNYANWANNSNAGTGFGPWSIETGGTVSGVFLGNPKAAGIQGMDEKSFGLYAKGGPGSFVKAFRPLTTALNVGDSVTFRWGVNWDSGNSTGKKGFNIWAGQTFLVNVEHRGSDAIFVAGEDSGIEYGAEGMTWAVTRISPTTLRVSATSRKPDRREIFAREVTVPSAAPSRLEFYAENLADGDSRQPYFNDFKIYRSPAVPKTGIVYGLFKESNQSKPWLKSSPAGVLPYALGSKGVNWLGDSGKALESEIDLVEVFGSVPPVLYLSAVAYGGGALGRIESQAPPTWDGDSSVQVVEYQPVRISSIRDENLDGWFDAGAPEMLTVVNNDTADGNYGLRRFYLDELLKDSAEITVKFKPNTAPSALVSNVEVFTNLNRREFAVLEEDRSRVTTTSTDTYFRAYPMTGPDGDGYYSITLPVNRCGAYRLQVRYKVNGGDYIYYTDHAQRRDCAIVVSPKKALTANMYEVNPLIVEAKDNTFAGRGTFLDLVNDPALPGEAGGFDGRPDALNKNHYAAMGVNMLWLQPIHPIGVDKRDINPETGKEFDPGSPYAVQDYWSVAPMLGRSNTAANALAEFQTFVSRLDNWGVDVMMDGTFNHSAPDVIMGQGAADLGFGYSPTAEIRDANHRWYAKEGFPAQQATGLSDIAIAPDRNDFGNWTDVREFYFGNYDALVKAKGTQNANKSYPDNAHKFEFLVERDEFFGHTPETRQVWEYFAYYPIYWIEKSGHLRGTPKEQSHKGIDGLRCDFAQGLPSQFWEYCINKTRSVKWDFLFMAESLDGFREVAGSLRHGVGYRSARHFDILNENIVFYWRDNFFGYDPNGDNAGSVGKFSTGETFLAYDRRRRAFDNVTLLNNLVSHDEVFPHNDVWSLAYAYAQTAAMDGIPMILYGQEAGAQNSATGYAASTGIFGPINSARNFGKYELNFGKRIPNFKVYNNMKSIWDSRDLDNGLGWAVQNFYGAVNKVRAASPALKSQNVFFLNRLQQGGGFENGMFAIGKVQQPGVSASLQDVVFVFVNNNYRGITALAAAFDLNGTAPGGSANYFGIERQKSYNIRDLVSANPAAFLWDKPKTGAELLDQGLYVGLPYQGKHAQFLKLVDVNADYTDTNGNGIPDALDPDIDGDGLTNEYELAHGLNPNDPSDRDRDLDGDGFSNYVEFLAGTAANDSNSALQIVNLEPGETQMVIRFKSTPGAIYKIRYSYDLASGWSDMPGGMMVAETAETEVMLESPGEATKAFYTITLVP